MECGGSTILAPTTTNYIDSKYLGLVDKVQDISKLNWGQFTFTYLLECIHAFNVRGQFSLQGNLRLLQYWYWEHVHAPRKYGISYSPIPPPVMARWDEENARLRTEAFNKEDLDGGEVVMKIAVQTSPHNNISTPPTMAERNEGRQRHENVSHQQQSQGNFLSSQQVDMILEFMNRNFVQLENKIGRSSMEMEQKLDSKTLYINKQLAEIRAHLKMEGAVQTRLANTEADLSGVRREMRDIRNLLQNNAASTSQAAYVQEPSTLGEQMSVPKNPIGTPNTVHDLQNKTPAEAANKHSPMPRIPISNPNYSCTQEDIDVVYFLRNSYDKAEVVLVGDNVAVTVEMLVPNVTKKMIYGQVIDAYAYVSDVDTALMSVLSTFDTKKLTGENGPIRSSWAHRIAKKCIGREMVFLPMNVRDCHWVLIVLNFRKQEVQILNSLASNHELRDQAKERTLVESIQDCINAAAADGQVTITEPINLTAWQPRCYTNIPQQTTNYSCGAFVLKYMLVWDGEKMTEQFTQSQIEVFSWKICTTLLFSEYNLCRLESYKKVLTKEEYEERFLKKNTKKVSNPDADKKPKEVGSAKRKRGRPRKVQPQDNAILLDFETETIAKRVQSKTSRVPKPGPLQKSPYKQI